MPPTLYETLGVSPTATPEQIKRARLRLVRLHPPEKSPEMFKAINRAYMTLFDPTARSDYDAERLHGPQIEELMAEADRLHKEEKPAEAINCLKRVVVLHPTSRMAWNLLGICYSRTHSWEQAKKAFTRLLALKADVALYHINYAFVFINEAQQVEDDRPEEKHRLADDARRLLKGARRLEPDNLDVYRAIASSYSAEGKFADAAMAAETTIATAKGTPNVDDYLYLAQRYLFDDQFDEVEGVASRLSFALAPSKEAIVYAGAVFARFAMELFEGHTFVPAHVFVTAAALIDTETEAIRNIKRAWDLAQQASDEYDRMKEDPIVIPPVRILMAVFTDEARNLPLGRPREEILKDLSEAMGTWDADEIQRAAYRVRTRYPAVYGLQPGVVDHLESPD